MDGNFEGILWKHGLSALNQRVCRLNPDDTLNAPYLVYALQAPLNYIEAATGATTVKSLSTHEFDYFDLPIPPRAEQERIASVLYTVDQMINTTQQLIDKHERTKKALTQDLLLNPDVESLRDTRLGPLPESWSIHRIGEFLSINPESFDTEAFDDDELRYVSLSDVSWGEFVSEQAIERADPPSRAQRVVREGDVLVGTVRPRQRSHAMVTDEHDGIVASSGFAVLRCGEHILPRFFIEEILSHRFFRQMDAYAAGGGYPSVTITDVKNMHIAVPPIEEQKEIAEKLSQVDAKEASLQNRLHALESVKTGLMQDLLSGEVRTPESLLVRDEVAEA